MKIQDYLDSYNKMMEISDYHYRQLLLLNEEQNHMSNLIPITAHYNGMLTSYQNSLDIIAHTIIEVDRIDISHEIAYFSSLKETIRSQNIKEIADKIKKSYQYKYMNAYSNTIKHNQLIDLIILDCPLPSEHLYPSKELFPGETIVTKLFKYKGNTYNEKHLINYSAVLKKFFDSELSSLKNSLFQ